MLGATDVHGVTWTTPVNIRDAPMQKQQTNNVIATEWHGVTRTTSVKIRDAPMQTQQIHGLKAQKLIAQGITLG